MELRRLWPSHVLREALDVRVTREKPSLTAHCADGEMLCFRFPRSPAPPNERGNPVSGGDMPAPTTGDRPKRIDVGLGTDPQRQSGPR